LNFKLIELILRKSVRKSCNEKRRSQPSKFITTRKLHKWKYKYKWKHGKNLNDSCAQDYSGANQRLSLEKNHSYYYLKKQKTERCQMIFEEN